jgi:hypothetical protein
MAKILVVEVKLLDLFTRPLQHCSPTLCDCITFKFLSPSDEVSWSWGCSARSSGIVSASGVMGRGIEARRGIGWQ